MTLAWVASASSGFKAIRAWGIDVGNPTAIQDIRIQGKTMDRETLVLLEGVLERAAAKVAAEGFARESVKLANPTRERIRLAGEYLLERAADRLPALDAYVSSSVDGNITLVLDRQKTR
ncbi:hypothetical protein ACFW0H_11350 [Pseudomonas sp. CR3202]